MLNHILEAQTLKHRTMKGERKKAAEDQSHTANFASI